MTTVLESRTGLTIDERVYENEDTNTKLPADWWGTVYDADHWRSRETETGNRVARVTLDAASDIEMYAALRKVVENGRGMVHGRFGETFALVHGVKLTGGGRTLTLYFPAWDRGAFTENSTNQPTRDSTTPVDMEEVPQTLREALDDLDEVRSVAAEEDCDEPSDIAITNARFVLRAMHRLFPQSYDVYPMSGGEIVVDGGDRDRRVGVFCYSDGRVQHVGWVNDERKEVRQTGTDDIPIDFLRLVLGRPEQ